MKSITKEILVERENFILFIHTPFCGTCHVAQGMLNQIEKTLNESYFYDMNGSLFPEFLQDEKIKSVPCLLIKVDGQVKKKIYAFHSIANILSEMTDFDLKLFKI